MLYCCHDDSHYSVDHVPEAAFGYRCNSRIINRFFEYEAYLWLWDQELCRTGSFQTHTKNPDLMYAPRGRVVRGTTQEPTGAVAESARIRSGILSAELALACRGIIRWIIPSRPESGTKTRERVLNYHKKVLYKDLQSS